ncbi:MAG TPA: phospholipase, partial [Lacipirellulaceae bacterium]|nr:phospholipase [Lacipirellulaceae bacterium]
MKLLLLVFLLGIFMLEASGDLKIEPGKQLPQQVTVQIDEGGLPHDIMIHYLLFTPREYKADGRPWPLLVFLHGLGECGNNELERVKVHGP